MVSTTIYTGIDLDHLDNGRSHDAVDLYNFSIYEYTYEGRAKLRHRHCKRDHTPKCITRLSLCAAVRLSSDCQ